MPVGWDFQRIPCDKHGTRLLFAVKAQQQVRKAKNGTGRLSAAPQNRFRQGMVGAMSE